MINKTEAERIATAVHALRPDWPVKSLMTLLLELKDWPYRDLAVTLTWVATDQDINGNHISQTPARVKEQGPWNGTQIESQEEIRARKQYARRIEEAKATIHFRSKEIRECPTCDEHGMVNGQQCRHLTTAKAGPS